MLPQRQLLYHRGIDDSVGTYVTDYLIFAVTFILLLCFIVLFIKNRSRTCHESGLAKSSYAVAALFAFVGTAALFGGLTHQYLQQVEPYTDWRDNISWLVVWRLTSSVSAGMAFVFLLLAQHLISSENVLNFNKALYMTYYFAASAVSAGILFHSIWMITDEEDPWSLSINFIVIFFCVAVDAVAASVVFCKRFRRHCDKSGSTISVSTTDTVTSSNNTESDKSKSSTQFLRSTEVTSISTVPSSEYRFDLLLYVIGPFLFLAGGVIQYLLGKVANCGDTDDPESQGCPLSNVFNHNAVLHIIHTISMIVFFAAELVAIRHRKRLHKMKTKSAGGSPI